MLSSRIKVELPKGGITVRRSGKYTTVYKVTRSYRNTKGQPTSNRIAIGRLDPLSNMLIPNDTYWEYYDDNTIETLPSYDSVRSVGASFVLGRIIASLGITDMLDECLGKSRSALALTTVLYMAARGNVLEYITDFCEGFTLNESPLSSQKASSLFSSITHDECMAFFKVWLAAQEAGAYLAYDVTSLSSYAKGIHEYFAAAVPPFRLILSHCLAPN